ncbi:MAG: ion channel [Dermatophilaceae bacterium]
MTSTWEDLQRPPSRTARWRAVARRQPSAFLLLVQVVLILALPFLEDAAWGRIVTTLLSLAALVTAVFTVRSSPALTWLSLLLAAPAAMFELWSFFTDSTAVLAAAHLALAAFYLYTAYALIAYMFEDSWVTADELFAVAACFTVLVFAFAYIFLGVQEMWPASFTSFEGPGQRTLSELLYFSGANLTSVGLSDVTAIRPHARSITTVEQLGGVMYVAMVISRLVALTVTRSRQ